MLTICTWLWGSKYGLEDVVKLQAGLRRHLKADHRLLCLTERERKISFPSGIERHAIKDPDLLKYPGCFARLRMFDHGWQANRRITGPMICIDLDVVIMGELDPLFDRPEDFVILQGANALNPCPFNGSLWMLRPGTHAEVWNDFSLEAVKSIRHYEFPDDQGWFWHKIPNAAGWPCGPQSGIYGFMKPGWPCDKQYPEDARLVVFPGWRSPALFRHLPWVRRHWRI
jgi:hypothetical protein